MDYYLENVHMGMLEKNKEFFTKIGNEDNNNKTDEIIEDEQEIRPDTFKLFESFLKEKDGIIKVISEMCDFSLEKIEKNTIIKDEKSLKEARNRLIMILTTYCEQPGLLDPVLPDIIPLMTNTSLILIKNYFKQNSKSQKITFEYILSLYQIIYNICKIRGFSPISKFFSSEVEIFEDVINFLISLPVVSNTTWTINYVLVLWTSLLAMVPFDIDTVDTKGHLIDNLINYLKDILVKSSNLREITAYALSKFMLRPDLIKKNYLHKYMQFAIKTLLDSKQNNDIFQNLGIGLSLFQIFKNGQAKDLELYIEQIITKILPYSFPDNIQASGVWRRTMTKLIQRVALIMLKPRNQEWRYKIQIRNALEKQEKIEENNKDNTNEFNNVKNNENNNSDKNNNVKNDNNEEQNEDEEELGYEVNFEYLENIIDFLINNLSDKEYIVRWSAAKGLGRVCERLTKPLVSDLFVSLSSLFSEAENEHRWHGACLALAELCKRGLLLPKRLPSLVPVLEKALLFEVDRGSYVAGTNVRDAACYIVWALARSFTSEIMRPHISKLSGYLILTAIFDREVNCRRAAAAAFQENVGRQGTFPNGIEIMTEADYFTIGTRTNCYLNISLFLSQFPSYFPLILDHLSKNRLFHLDPSIRSLSATALGLITPLSPEIFVEKIIPKTLEYVLNVSPRTREGALKGIGRILVGLSGKWDFMGEYRKNRRKMLNGLSNKEKKVLQDSEYRQKFEKMYSEIKYKNNMNLLLDKPELLEKITGIIKKLDESKLYRGKGSELMRNAVNEYIKLLSYANIPISNENYIYYHEILIDNIKQSKADIQESAVETLKILNKYYGSKFENDEKVKEKIDKILIEMISRAVNDENIHVTKGYTMAIVAFNKSLTLSHYKEIIESLVQNCKAKQGKNNDYTTRKCAIESLTYITKEYIEEKQEFYELIMNTLLSSLSDYEMDAKIGDVGSYVRTSSVKGLLNLLSTFIISGKYDIFNKFIVISLNGAIKQLSEKIAMVRREIGNGIQRFFYGFYDGKNEDKKEIFEILEKYIPHLKELKDIFLTDIDFDEDDNVFTIKWIEPEFAYKKIMPIIELDEYSEKFIEGLIRSVACISEDVQKCSINEYIKILKNSNNKKKIIENTYKVILSIFKNNAKEDKFIEPLETAVSTFLSLNIFIQNDYIIYLDKIQIYVKNENIESKNIHKILDSIDIYYNILFIGKEDKYNILFRCLKSLMFLLCHKYPVVRKKASEILFLFFNSIEDSNILGIDEEEFDHINALLMETDWTEKVVNIKNIRNTISDKLKIKLK